MFKRLFGLFGALASLNQQDNGPLSSGVPSRPVSYTKVKPPNVKSYGANIARAAGVARRRPRKPSDDLVMHPKFGIVRRATVSL